MAPSVTNYSDIQQDEIEALKSIYGDDFVEEELKVGPWKKAIDRAFYIRLKGNASGEDTAALNVCASLPATYPKTLPKLSLKLDDDIRPEVRTAAEELIRRLPPTLVGSEMIYDITTALQEILDRSDDAQFENIPTLDEERNAKEEAAKEEARGLETQRQLEALYLAKQEAADYESQLLSKLAKQKEARAERRSAVAGDEPERATTLENIAGGQAFERPSVKFKDPCGKTISVKAVFHKLQFRQGPVGRLYLVQTEEDAGKAPGDTYLCLKQCICEGSDISFRRRLQQLESRLDYQMHLAQHPNVVNPLNFRIQRSESGSSEDQLNWSISILTKFAPKGSLHDFLAIAETLDARRAKSWFIQLLDGLHHYHQQGVIHGAVHLNNVLLWESEAHTTIVKWSDGAYAAILHELSRPSWLVTPQGWTAPEHVEQGDSAASSVGTDIWCFGICLIQVAFGSNVQNSYKSPAAALGDLNLSRSLRSVLQAVFNADVKKRPSAWDLLHFEFFRNDETFSSDEGGQFALTRPRTRRESEAPTDASEYSRKFVEEGRLGRGGFGEVFRARNRTDGQLYAIKKIKAQSRAALDPVLSETTVLSRLNHPNVVRYFSSWIEEDSTAAYTGASKPESSLETDSLSLSSLGLNPVLPPSSRGLDFISSNHIVFGNASDSESESGGETSESESEFNDDASLPVNPKRQKDNHLQARSERTSSDASSHLNGNGSMHHGFTVLYIQMEYCKQETLRNLISSGIQANAAEVWRLFRQIVQGLAHVHSASIVHRDLKPENIFVDDNGDLRIGDFGLARPGEYRVAMVKADASRPITSFTKDIGTAWYVAPEVRSASGSKYDEKADLFSLGVIFLEMNVTFATGMERAEILEPLAQRNHTLPKTLESPERALQVRVLESLLSYEPSQRPSCADLLNEIPAQGEDQASQLVRRELRNHNSQLRAEVIQSLFAQSARDTATADTPMPLDMNQKLKMLDGVAANSRSLSDLELQTKVKCQLTSIFHWHGAVERTDTPAVFPHHPYYSISDVVRLLDASGNLLQLPYDLILPNAILLAKSTRVETKTFAFGDVYRPDPRKEEPNIYGEADFDIVSTGTSNLALQEAESIKVIDEIITAFPSLSSANMCYHVNHSRLLDKILAYCEIEQAKWFPIKDTLSKLNTGDWTWLKVRHELRAPPLSVPSTCLDELERFDFRDAIDKAIPRLRLMLPGATDVETSFTHLTYVLQYLSRMNVHRKVYITPLSSYNEKFYKGQMFFQCLHDRKKKAVFAAGGRYDRLVRDHQAIPSRDSIVHSVGFQMTWSGLCAGMLSYLNAQSKSKAKRRPQIDKITWSTRRCDVLVDCYDTNLLDSVGIKILNELWTNNISTELANISDSGASSTFVRTSPIKDDHNWIVLIKSADSVKIRNANRQDETEVRVADLAHYMRNEIRERDRNEGKHPSPMLSRLDSQQDKGPTAHEPDVKVLVSQSKAKKSNRKAIVEEAITQSQEWRKSSVQNPILAIEIRDDIFDGLQNTSLEDSDSWRRLIQTAPAGDRQYLGQVQTMLKEQRGTSAAFVYNFRSKAILHYPLPGG